MNLAIATTITIIASLFSSAEITYENNSNQIIYEQQESSKHKVHTKIIYTKAPTPWVKVFNN